MKTISRNELAEEFGISMSTVTRRLRADGILAVGYESRKDSYNRMMPVPVYDADVARQALKVKKQPKPEPVQVDVSRIAQPRSTGKFRAYVPSLALKQAEARAAEVYGDRGFLSVTGIYVARAMGAYGPVTGLADEGRQKEAKD